MFSAGPSAPVLSLTFWVGKSRQTGEIQTELYPPLCFEGLEAGFCISQDKLHPLGVWIQIIIFKALKVD